jgi:hypothetical protein
MVLKAIVTTQPLLKNLEVFWKSAVNIWRFRWYGSKRLRFGCDWWLRVVPSLTR